MFPLPAKAFGRAAPPARSTEAQQPMHPSIHRGAGLKSAATAVGAWALCLVLAPCSYSQVPANAVFLGYERDKSGVEVIYVQSTTGWVPVRKGDSATVQVPDNRFAWLSDGSTEYTTAPEGTNLVVVYRSPQGRSIDWACYKAAKSPAEPVYLDYDIDRSGEYQIYVESTTGWVAVGLGESKWVRVPSNRFEWYSGGGREFTTAAPGTNLVKVTRGTDRLIYWEEYHENR